MKSHIMAAENYYEVLGLRPGANDEDVKQAFRERAKLLHPDRNPGDPEAERRFKLMNTAHEALRDAARRRAYDEWLAFARKHERSRLAQWVRLAALVAVLLVGPSLALYWALVFLDLAGPGKEQAAVSTAIETAARDGKSAARPNPSPKDDTARLQNPLPPASAPSPPPAAPQRPARTGESVAVLAAPPVTDNPSIPDATASIDPKKRADSDLEEPATPRDTRPSGPSRDREEPGAPRDTRSPGQSGDREEPAKPRDVSPSRPPRDGEEPPRSLRSIVGANEGETAGNTPNRASEYLPPASGATNPPVQAAPASPDGERDTPARSMARMIAELKESGALPQDRASETPPRQAALPDEQRRAPPSPGEPDDFTDCDRCPQMSLVEATDFAPSPGARRPLATRTLAISKSEVTVSEWNACVEDGACRGFREYGASSHKPILDVTRSEALDYASWLSRKSGKIYRPMKTGGWSRGNSGPAADNGRGDCQSSDPQRWMDEDCDAPRGQRGNLRGGNRPGGSGGFRVARTLGPDD
jgi:hypothetical protein